MAILALGTCQICGRVMKLRRTLPRHNFEHKFCSGSYKQPFEQSRSMLQLEVDRLSIHAQSLQARIENIKQERIAAINRAKSIEELSSELLLTQIQLRFQYHRLQKWSPPQIATLKDLLSSEGLLH